MFNFMFYCGLIIASALSFTTGHGGVGFALAATAMIFGMDGNVEER